MTVNTLFAFAKLHLLFTETACFAWALTGILVTKNARLTRTLPVGTNFHRTYFTLGTLAHNLGTVGAPGAHTLVFPFVAPVTPGGPAATHDVRTESQLSIMGSEIHNHISGGAIVRTSMGSDLLVELLVPKLVYTRRANQKLFAGRYVRHDVRN